MPNFSEAHDLFEILVNSDGTGMTQSVLVSSTLTASTTAFSSQTRAIQLVGVGPVSSSGVYFVRFYSPSQSSAVGSVTDAAIPNSWVQVFKIHPGQRAAIVGGDTTAGNTQRVFITELS